MFSQEIKDLLSEIKTTLNERSVSSRIAEGTYYLNDGSVLCCPYQYGDFRFPYSFDGFTLWAHSGGYIHAKEGAFQVFKPVHDEVEPSVNFFAGIELEDGTYFPISILGGTQQLFEPFQVDRFLVYSLTAAYYIADTDIATFVVRVNVSERKEMCFSAACINKGKNPLKVCFTSYFEMFLKNDNWDDMWSKRERSCKYMGNGSFLLERQGNDYHAAGVNRKISGTTIDRSYYTTSKIDFLGYANRRIMNAECLKRGNFEKQLDCVGGEVTPVAAEILHFKVKDSARIDYVLPIVHCKEERERVILHDVSAERLDAEVEQLSLKDQKRLDTLDIRFRDWDAKEVHADVWNYFIKNVQKQVDFCAMGKSYVEEMLGTRDVFQQLEQAIIWDAEQAREKIVRALGYITPSGRSPRQFSIVEQPDVIPKMDLREFIDQGNWIISCVYSYLAWTNDYSILQEKCGYYEIVDDCTVKRSELQDSVLEHIVRIADYLTGNTDVEDGTNCLHILYGDWNDALDGLGKTDRAGRRFGTGVSVMASLHLYQNLYEMSQILDVVDVYSEKAEYYKEKRRLLSEGLRCHAVVTNEKGEKRLVHGWGDKGSYRIGSFCDSDGKSRISFAPNAFWASTGLVKETPELKYEILEALHALDSRFGLKTLIPAFEPGAPGVGRLADTLPGTAENACVYCHATMFSIMALFALGDADFAWKQLMKVLPITHEYVTKSPFVMSNSYLDNPEFGLNGESAIDWYTGAGTVLLKVLVRYGLGILPDLNGITIQTPAKMPCSSVHAKLRIKGYQIQFSYENKQKGQRKIYVDGKEVVPVYDEWMETEKVYIENNDLHDNMEILVKS